MKVKITYHREIDDKQVSEVFSCDRLVHEGGALFLYKMNKTDILDIHYAGRLFKGFGASCWTQLEIIE